MPVRRLRLAWRMAELCAGSVPEEQQLAAFLVAESVWVAHAELQECVAAAAAYSVAEAATQEAVRSDFSLLLPAARSEFMQNPAADVSPDRPSIADASYGGAAAAAASPSCSLFASLRASIPGTDGTTVHNGAAGLPAGQPGSTSAGPAWHGGGCGSLNLAQHQRKTGQQLQYAAAQQVNNTWARLAGICSPDSMPSVWPSN